MKPIENDEEAAKIPVKTILKILKQELKENKEARLWFQLLFLGIKQKFWKPEDSLEHAVQIMKSIGKSFEEPLDYVV